MEEIANSKRVGCYHCIQVYSPLEITVTTDNGKTAVCAKCGIDSVLPDTSPFSLDNKTLNELNKKWF